MALAVGADDDEALGLVQRCDAKVSDDLYRALFDARYRSRLVRLGTRKTTSALQVCVEQGRRLGLDDLVDRSAGTLTDIHAQAGDGEALIELWQRLAKWGLPLKAMLQRGLEAYLERRSIKTNSAWSHFLRAVDPKDLPDLFEVHMTVGKILEGARLARTSEEMRWVLECCRKSEDLEAVRVGINFAESLHESGIARKLHGALALGLQEEGRYESALMHHERAGNAMGISRCHEALGRHIEALESAPTSAHDRLLTLAATCTGVMQDLSTQGELVGALDMGRRVQAVLARMENSPVTIQHCLASIGRHIDALLKMGRDAFQDRLAGAEPGGREAQAIRLEWSAFEESGGNRMQAARLAEEAGDYLRASILWEQDERYGEAIRVLGPHSEQHEVLRKMAELAESGGDPGSAADLYERLGDLKSAATQHEASGRWERAADCLCEVLRDEEAAESSGFERVMRRAGRGRDLMELWLRLAEVADAKPRMIEKLQDALQDGTVMDLAPQLHAQIEAVVAAAEERRRLQLRERIPALLRQAEERLAARYAPAWGLDLGTSKCAVAVYDCVQNVAVTCSWRGQPQFSSTLAVTSSGDELTGLTEEELLAPAISGVIVRSKRDMGSKTRYPVGALEYRPEEVAARLIVQGQKTVRAFLCSQARDIVAELAKAQGTEISTDWLEREILPENLTIALDKAVVTIPAYFGYSQKRATRDACTIAGIELLRLMHEPTAACLAANSVRTLGGTVAIVDLGAGTLDVSVITAGDSIFEVDMIRGDNLFGSSDFDLAIYDHLRERIILNGKDPVDPGNLLGRRLRLAAEQLKIQLSSAPVASYYLLCFGDHGDLQVELTRAEVESIIQKLLKPLRRVCAESAQAKPGTLLLVGGGMLSPMLQKEVEAAFSLRALKAVDPRAAVSHGAAIQAAILCGQSDGLVIDIVPFSLGVRVVPESPGGSDYSAAIERGTAIPCSGEFQASTRADDQTNIHVEVFQGESSKADENVPLGHFVLDGILPAPRGTPKLRVEFDVDASSVLTVTATDEVTGKKKSIRIQDTTLLSVAERDAMRSRLEMVNRLEEDRVALDLTVEALSAFLAEDLAAGIRSTHEDWLRSFEASRSTLTSVEMSAEEQQSIANMFNLEDHFAVRVALDCDRFANLLRTARNLQGARQKLSIESPSFRGAVEELARQAEQLVQELGASAEMLRIHGERLTRWTAVLRNLAIRVSDPAERFDACRRAGEWSSAVAAFSKIATDARSRSQVDQMLDCMAEMRDRAGYRRALEELTGAQRMPVEGLKEIPSAITRAIAQIQVGRGSDSPSGGSGALVGADLVVTSRRVLTNTGDDELPGTSRIQVYLEDEWMQVCEIRSVSEDAGLDLVLLRLDRPSGVPPLRIGASQLTELGEQVFALGFGKRGEDTVGLCPTARTGVVNRFRRAAGGKAGGFEVGIGLVSGMEGGPILNAWGEAIGVTRAEPGGPERVPDGEQAVGSRDSAFADSLEELRRSLKA